MDHLHIVLYVVLAGVTILFFIFQGQPREQRDVIVFAGVVYILWSLVYHYHKANLSLALFVEYLLFILFALFLLMGTWLP